MKFARIVALAALAFSVSNLALFHPGRAAAADTPQKGTATLPPEQMKKHEKEMADRRQRHARCAAALDVKLAAPPKEVAKEILPWLKLVFALFTSEEPVEEKISRAKREIEPLLSSELADMKKAEVRFKGSDTPFHDGLACHGPGRGGMGYYDPDINEFVICIFPDRSLWDVFSIGRHESLHFYQFHQEEFPKACGRRLRFLDKGGAWHASGLAAYTVSPAFQTKRNALQRKLGDEGFGKTCLAALDTYCAEVPTNGMSVWERFLVAENAKTMGLPAECEMITSGFRKEFEDYSRLYENGSPEQVDALIIAAAAKDIKATYVDWRFKNAGRLGALSPDMCGKAVPADEILYSSCE